MAHNGNHFGAAFYKNLPGASALKLYLAIFFVFSPLALIMASGPAREWPIWLSLSWILGSGLVAVGYALTFTRSLKYLYAAVPLHFLVGMGSATLMARSGVSGATVTIAGMLCVAFIVAGYVCFIMFINGEGARSLRLQTEVGLAQQIHSHLVPPVSLHTPQLEIFGQSIASAEVGGDLVDVVQDGASTGLYVADVSGHGVKAGVFMGMVKSAIRMKLLHSGTLDDLCGDLNRVVFQVKQPDMFVTFAAMRFTPERKADYVLAGHPSILHYQRSTGTVVELPNGAPPLGVLAEFSFESGSTEAAQGDLFVLLTDGLIEIVGEWDPRAGLERLKELLQGSADLPLKEAHANILRAIRSRAEVDDDQTLLMARVL